MGKGAEEGTEKSRGFENAVRTKHRITGLRCMQVQVVWHLALQPTNINHRPGVCVASMAAAVLDGSQKGKASELRKGREGPRGAEVDAQQARDHRSTRRHDDAIIRGSVGHLRNTWRWEWEHFPIALQDSSVLTAAPARSLAAQMHLPDCRADCLSD